MCIAESHGYVDKIESYWKNIGMQKKLPKIQLFSLNNKHYAIQTKNLIPSLKQRGGSTMVWACVAAFGLVSLPSLVKQ